MSPKYPAIVSFCLSLSCLYAVQAQAAAAPGHRPLRLAANVTCSEEAKSSNNLQLAQARMQAARADLEVTRGGHCRPNALSLEQHAYQALEALEKQENSDTNKTLQAQHLQAIHQTMEYLRSTEQAVEQSMKSDPQGQVGVDVTALDNAMHALDGAYRMSASAETAPSTTPASKAQSSGGETTACVAMPGPLNTDAEKLIARLTAARDDLSGKYHGRCRQASLENLDMAGRDLEAMQNAEVKSPSFPNDKTKQAQRLSALKRARQYQLAGYNAVKDDLAQDPQATRGIGVTSLNNAIATLKASYGS